ncbi:hypothetical protein ACMFMF_006721 [Clarireedia jacksonii]
MLKKEPKEPQEPLVPLIRDLFGGGGLLGGADIQGFGGSGRKGEESGEEFRRDRERLKISRRRRGKRRRSYSYESSYASSSSYRSQSSHSYADDGQQKQHETIPNYLGMSSYKIRGAVNGKQQRSRYRKPAAVFCFSLVQTNMYRRIYC